MKTILGILCLGLALQARAVAEDRFLGGSFDGFAVADFQTYSASASPRFLGGPCDGFSRGSFMQYDGDSPQSISPRFHGGTYDGFAQDQLIQYRASSPQSISPRFAGGSYDGFDQAMLIQYSSGSSPQTTGPRFHGGSYDGAEFSGVAGLLNPLTGDLDADTLIDWWEAIYFNTLTALTGSGDFDSDGATDGAEFVADTDPADKTSYFHIAAVSNLTTLCFDSSAARLYAMQTASNLMDGIWLPVSGMGPRLGTGGADSMEDTNLFRFGFYRLTVELP